MSAPLDRRRALVALGTSAAAYAAGAAIVAGGIAVADEATGTTVPAERAAWDRAWRAYTGAKAAYEADNPEQDRIFARWDAEQPSLDEIDWRNVPGIVLPHEHRNQVAHFDDLDALQRRYVDGEDRWWWGTPAQKQRSLDAIDSIRRFRAKYAATKARLGIQAANDRNNELSLALSNAEDALMALPAPDGPALAWKLRVLFETEDDDMPGWSGDYIRQTRADVTRLLGGEAA